MIYFIKKLIPSSFKIFIRNKIDVIKYRGDKYQCPICNYRCKQFLTIGLDLEVIKDKKIIGAGRRNARCPKCSSNDRERLVFCYIKKIINKDNILSNAKLLHIAPEKRLMDYIVSLDTNEYVCGDLFAEGYNYSGFVKKLDVTNLPFENDYFDLIICNHVLEHIDDDIKAMKEIYRVLKNNGKAIMQVPISFKLEKTFENSKVTSPKQREAIFGQRDHVRIYGKDYFNRLESCGFSVDVLKLSTEWEYYGTNPKEPLIVVNKNV